MYIKKHNCFYIKIFCTILLGSIAFWALAILAHKLFQFTLSQDSIVLTLVGILATFVVVSNYAQVKEVENQFENKINEVKEIENKFDIKIKEIEDKLTETIDSKIKDYDCDISACFLLIYGHFELKDGKVEYALDYCMDALKQMRYSKNKRLLNTIMKNIEDILTKERHILHSISVKSQMFYQHILGEIEHEKTKKITDLLLEIPTRNYPDNTTN